jgi:hypothetical protein
LSRDKKPQNNFLKKDPQVDKILTSKIINDHVEYFFIENLSLIEYLIEKPKRINCPKSMGIVINS